MRKLLILPILLILTACATFKEHETTAKLVTQYATLKYLEKVPAAELDQRRERIRAIATDVKALATGETSLILLQAAVSSQLDKAGLSPADRLLADGLVQVIVAELQQRIGSGVLSPEQLVQVSQVLDWVITATQMA